MSFFKQFLTALYRFGDYPQLLNIKGIRAFVYTVLTVIFTVAVMTAASVPGYIALGGIQGMAEKLIPEFSVTGGHLKMDKIDVTDNMAGARIYINTEDSKPDMSKTEGFVGNILIAGRDELYAANGVQEAKLTFKEINEIFGEKYTSKQGIVDYLGNKSVRTKIIGFMTAVLFVGKLFSALSEIIMLALIGNIINMASIRMPFKFGQMLKLSAYARTLPMVLSLVVPIIAGIQFNSLVFYAVGAVYMYKGLQNTKQQSEIIIADISGLQN